MLVQCIGDISSILHVMLLTSAWTAVRHRVTINCCCRRVKIKLNTGAGTLASSAAAAVADADAAAAADLPFLVNE